jgi:hypothetical protein
MILSAIWQVLQMSSAITFYAIGQPFGGPSDFSNAMNVLFLRPLAVFIHAYSYPTRPVISVGATVIGTAGSVRRRLPLF